MERHLALSGKILGIETAFIQRRSGSHDRSGNSNGQYECQHGYAPQNQEVYQKRYLLPILSAFRFCQDVLCTNFDAPFCVFIQSS